MANKNLKFTVEADVQGFQEGMQEAVYATDKTEKAIQNLIDSTPNVRKAFREAKKEAQQLASAFSQLTEAERNSAPGRQLAEDLQNAMGRAAELQDVIDDTNKSITRLSQDQQAVNALSDAFSTMGSVLSSSLGVIATATGKQEDFNRAIAAYTTVTSLANAAVKIKNMLQKESNVMLAIGNIQTKAAAKAEDLKTASTIKATIAQKAFNAVAKANPYVLLATAVIAVTTALATFVALSKKSKKAHEEEKKALEQEKQATDAFKDTLKNTVPAFQKLVIEWKNLKSLGDKTDWIKKNQSEFNNLGLKVNGVTDAERIFAQNAKLVVKSFELRAKAAAYATRIQAKYSEVLEKQAKMEQINSKYDAEIAKAEKQYGGITLESKKNEINDRRANELAEVGLDIGNTKNEIKDYLKEQVSLYTEIDNILSSVNGKEKTKTNITKEQKTHYDKLKQAVTDADNAIKNLTGLEPDFELKKANLTKVRDEAAKVLEDYEYKIGIKIPKTEVEKAKEQAKKELEDAKISYTLAVINDDKAAQDAAEKAAEVAQDKLDRLELHIKVKPEIDKEAFNKELSNISKSLQPDDHYNYDFSFLPDNLSQQAEEAQNKLNKLIDARKQYEELAEKYKNNPEQLAQINTELAKTDAEYQKLISDVEKFNKISSKIKERENELDDFKDTVGSIDDVIGSIDGVVGAISNLTNAFDEGKSGWEKFMAVWDTAIAGIEAVMTIIEAFNTIQDVFNVKKEISASATAKEAAAQTALATASTAASIAVATVQGIQDATTVSTLALYKATKQLAAAQIFAAHAYIPFAGVGIATGMVAEMEAVLASLMAFAGGGIIPGGRSLSDNRLAMVESGEMILNHRQQNNLFNAIDKNRLGTGSSNVQVTGVIKGKDLLLVQRNYNSISRKSGQQIHIG